MNESDFDAFDQLSVDIFQDKLITPDDIRGNYSTVQDAIFNGPGWPSIESTRGKIVLVFLDLEPLYILSPHSHLEGRSTFLCGDGTNTTDKNIVFMCLGPDPSIASYISDGFMVRVRSDSEYNRGDPTRPIETVMEDYFKVIDLNQDGYVTNEEILEFFKALETPVQNSQLDELYSLCSGSNSTVNLTQFQCAMRIILSQGNSAFPTAATTDEVMSDRNISFDYGSHFISTDWNTYPCNNPDPAYDYWVAFPSKTPFRCNVITTKSLDCSDSDFENSTITYESDLTCPPIPVKQNSSNRLIFRGILLILIYVFLV